MRTTIRSGRLPYFKTMTDDELRAQYRAFRDSLYQWSTLASHSSRPGGPSRRIANATGHCLRACQIIEGIARQRGIALVQRAAA